MEKIRKCLEQLTKHDYQESQREHLSRSQREKSPIVMQGTESFQQVFEEDHREQLAFEERQKKAAQARDKAEKA